MKKVFFTVIGVMFYAMIFAQGSVSFYTNNGTTKVTAVKADEFDNLMVKYKIPKLLASYDYVELRIYTSSVINEAKIDYVGKGDIKLLISTPNLEKWIIKPGKEPGEFSIGNNEYVNYNDLCEYPRTKGIPSIVLHANITAYTISGTSTYWDKFSESYETEYTYNTGKVIAEGILKINQLPPIMAVNSKFNLFSFIKYDAKHFEMNSFVSDDKEVEVISNYYQIDNNNSTFLFKVCSDKYAVDKINNLGDSYTGTKNPYEFIKQDILQSVANNSLYERKNSTSPIVKIYKKSSIKWGLDDVYCFTLKDKDKPKGKSKNRFKSLVKSISENPGSNSDPTKIFSNTDLWKIEKIGNYDFDVLRIPETYCKTNIDISKIPAEKKSDAKSAEMVIYAIHHNGYTIIGIPTYQFSSYGHNIFYKTDEKRQTDFVNKTIESFKFLDE